MSDHWSCDAAWPDLHRARRPSPAQRPSVLGLRKQAQPMPLASYDVVANWFDVCTDAEMLCSVLRFCETLQGPYWHSVPKQLPQLGQRAQETARALHDVWYHGSVVVSNTVEIVAGCDAIASGEPVSVTPWLTRVGRTSWVISFSLSANSGVVARVATVMVNTDPDDLAKASPIPLHLVEVMRALIEDNEPRAAQEGLRGPPEMAALDDKPDPGGAGGGGLYSWRSTIRKTDCDSLGHVNNAKYALLAEEARALACRNGGYNLSPLDCSGGVCDAATAAATAERQAALISAPARLFYCHYSGQPRPYDELRIETWLSPTKLPLEETANGEEEVGAGATLGFVAYVKDDIVATMVMRSSTTLLSLAPACKM